MLVETALKKFGLSIRLQQNLVVGQRIYQNINQLVTWTILKTTKKYSYKLDQYNETRQNILDTIDYYSDKNEVIKHYLKSDYQIPLWAYFEVITLGQFSRFLGSLTKSSREKLNQDFTIIPNRSNSLELVVNALIELRNATMHNSAIF